LRRVYKEEAHFTLQLASPKFQHGIRAYLKSIVGLPASSTLQAHWAGMKREGVCWKFRLNCGRPSALIAAFG